MLLSDLVKCPSYSDFSEGDRPVAFYLDEFFRRHEIESQLVEVQQNQYNVVARVGYGNPTILLVGHLDTVQIDNMEVPPFGELLGDTLYGRGTADMKSGVAAMVATLVDMSEDTNLTGSVLFLGDALEEQNSLGAADFINKMEETYDYAVIGEPTDMQLAVAHKGVLWSEITFGGKTAHASMPSKGINAISACVEFINALKNKLVPELERVSKPGLGTQTLNIGAIHGGANPNVVPAECVVRIDIRYLPGTAHADLMQQLSRMAQAVAARSSTSVRVEDIPEIPLVRHLPFEIGPDASFAQTIRRELESLGMSTEFRTVPFWTEAPLFQREGSVPTVVIGPGRPELAHTPNEHVSISSLLAAREVYCKLCRNLACT